MEVDADNLCTALVKLDTTIRFVGIENKMGRPVAAQSRKGLRLLLNSEELNSHASYSVTSTSLGQNRGLRISFVMLTFLKRPSALRYGF
jgi:hypothetical protein